jgi:hypothetical protein
VERLYHDRAPTAARNKIVFVRTTGFRRSYDLRKGSEFLKMSVLTGVNIAKLSFRATNHSPSSYSSLNTNIDIQGIRLESAEITTYKDSGRIHMGYDLYQSTQARIAPVLMQSSRHRKVPEMMYLDAHVMHHKIFSYHAYFSLCFASSIG